MARKKKRNIKQVQIKTNSKSWFNRLMNSRMTVVIFISFILISIINLATIISSIDTLQSKYNDFWIWFGSSERFTGKWNNSSEGYIDGIYPGTILKNDSDIMISVDLKVKDHQVTGVIVSSFFIDSCINSTKSKDFKANMKLFCETLSHMLLIGNKSPFKNNFDAEVFNYESGKKILYATLHFNISNEELEITNKNIGKYSSFFPNKAFLIKEPEFVD